MIFIRRALDVVVGFNWLLIIVWVGIPAFILLLLLTVPLVLGIVYGGMLLFTFIYWVVTWKRR